MSDLVKQSDLQFSVQLRTFSTKLPNYAVVLGLTTEELDAVAADAMAFHAAVQGMNRIRAHAQAWTAFRDLLRTGEGKGPTPFPTAAVPSEPPAAVAPGIDHRFRKLVRRIKAHAAYTTGMGEDLGIHIDHVAGEPAAPALRLRTVGGVPHIRFTKRRMHGIFLYCRRGGEEKPTLLATVTRSPYVDSRPNLHPGVPETREYFAYYMMSDQHVGTKGPVADLMV
jgi:hypothetical protein